MLVTMQNAELIGKLVALAGGDVDLVQRAIRTKAGRRGADLEQVVQYIVAHRGARSAAVADQPADRIAHVA